MLFWQLLANWACANSIEWPQKKPERAATFLQCVFMSFQTWLLLCVVLLLCVCALCVLLVPSKLQNVRYSIIVLYGKVCTNDANYFATGYRKFSDHTGLFPHYPLVSPIRSSGPYTHSTFMSVWYEAGSYKLSNSLSGTKSVPKTFSGLFLDDSGHRLNLDRHVSPLGCNLAHRTSRVNVNQSGLSLLCVTNEVKHRQRGATVQWTWTQCDVNGTNTETELTPLIVHCLCLWDVQSQTLVMGPVSRKM